ncbi:hypothetical protein KP509_02G053800 [Ceratopteris richardii]|nr:hypothetical protein KP509_02G053800 [Ceratopteris richardii]
MYAKCGLLMRAREVHNELSLQTIASWNALIAGYTHQGKCTEALDCYACMRNHGFTPNSITYACILKACGITQQVNIGKAIHDEIAPKGFLAKDIVLGTAVVDMYAKCGLMMKAEEVLEDLFPRDVVSWNALILGYIQNGPVKKAFECFSKLQNEGLSPNATTHACILKACGILGERKIGEQIHNELVGQGLLKRDVVLGNALVDMYSRCGMLSKAESMLETLWLRNVATWNALITGYADQGRSKDALKCFRSMQTHNINPDIVSWNALLGGYAHQGLADEALHSFELMQSDGMDPDPTTFVCILNACSHSGLVDKGEMCYENMITAYGLMPVIEHYVCMVDLFGRSGDMDMARVVVETMPICDDHKAWDALLGACQKWGNKRLGKLAFDHALLVNDGDAIAHVCMENICITAAIREGE